jgi:MinD superfamily P-loop ATPase
VVKTKVVDKTGKQWKTCKRCQRVGRFQFVEVSSGLSMTPQGYECERRKACDRRRKRRARWQAAKDYEETP